MTVDEALDIVASKAAGRTRYEGADPWVDEVLAVEVRRLRAEVARLSEPDMFWNGGCPDTPYLSAQDVLDDACAGQLIVEVEQAHRLPSKFVAEVCGDDDEPRTMEFPTREAAEAWLDARQKDATP